MFKTDPVTIKRSTIVAAYMIVTAFFMGGQAAVGPYSCPGDHGWRRVGITLMIGAIWPVAAAAGLLGYTAHNTKCFDGSLYVDPKTDL